MNKTPPAFIRLHDASRLTPAEAMLARANARRYALPPSLADSATADALRAICDLDLSVLEIDPPRGFGRD